MSKTKSKKAWDEIAKNYSTLIVPNRPSIDDCKIYGEMILKVLKNVKKPKIMVMGSTPEIRRILYGLEALQNATVFCVDISDSMYEVMKKFIFKSPHFREKFFQYSWLDTKFKNETFDLIIGDEVICNVPTVIHGKLFMEVSRILKRNRAWITRHNFFLKKNKTNSTKEILLDLGKRILKGTIDFQYAENLLFLEVFYHLAATGLTANSMTDQIELIKQEYKASFKSHRLNKIIKELLYIHENNFVAFTGDHKWHVLSKERSLAELKRFFTIEKEAIANDYPTAKNSPIYLLRKK